MKRPRQDPNQLGLFDAPNARSPSADAGRSDAPDALSPRAPEGGLTGAGPAVAPGDRASRGGSAANRAPAGSQPADAPAGNTEPSRLATGTPEAHAAEQRLPPEPPSTPAAEALEGEGSRIAPHAGVPLEQALRLDRNLALMAGAGTGKTHSLITLALHLLGGARQAGPVPPHALGLLTFTDKAAEEMRQRLYARADALAQASPLAKEPELFASYRALELAPPGAGFWRGVRDALGSAPVSTFHALCLQLLRDAPVGGEWAPGFELLDDLVAKELVADTADRVVLAALERGDLCVADLAREWSLSGPMGLSPSLVHVLQRAREEGLRPAQLPISDLEAAQREFAASLERCHEEWARAEAEAARALKPEKRELVRAVGAQLQGLNWDNAAERLAAIGQALGSSRAVPALRAALFGGQGRGLSHAWMGVRIAPYERAFRGLLSDLSEAWETVLRRRNALDFTGLLTRTRDLLRDDLAARRWAQSRFSALLVDELQDTNRLQLELIHLLCEQREGAPRPLSAPLLDGASSALGLPLQPAFVCVVGDRKQSIYEFRGADVSVVEQAALAIDASGGLRAFLRSSRRASPGLVSFFNRVFPKLMVDPRTQVLAPMETEGAPAPPPSSRSFEVSYLRAQDDLLAHRPVERIEPPVERYVGVPAKPAADDLRYIDARALARRVRLLLESGQHRGGEIALLFRRFSYVEEYRQALLTEGIAHRVVRGRGFYGAQEVLDVAALLSLLADPSDAISLAVVLRSPWVGLCDSSLLRLAQESGGALDARWVLTRSEVPEALSASEKVRLGELRRVWSELNGQRHRLGVSELLRHAFEQLGYREAMAATAFGPQVLANLSKLEELAARREARAPLECGAFARELSELAEQDPLEAQAETVDSDDRDAVTLCTIHQAKGLEWPVVVLPELFSPLPTHGARARFERDAGLCLRLAALEIEQCPSPRFERAKAERRAREEADFKRVRYVAMTRARDLLILGATKKGSAWADLEAACEGAPEVLEQPFEIPEQWPALPLARPVGDSAAVERIAERLGGRPAPRARRVLLPVTQLQDFALCPTRYRLVHAVGLSEFPAEVRSLDGGPFVAEPNVRERGTHAHRLLEHVRFGEQNDLRALEHRLGLPPDEAAREWVERFLRTGFAQQLRQVRRELPFVLRLEGRDFTLHLRGAIDLLVQDSELLVVDYKSSFRPDRGLEPYAFQLGCYVLAARRLTGAARIRAGIAFLREADPAPQWLEQLDRLNQAELEQTLVQAARALCAAQVDGKWASRTLSHCRALKCGYVYRCHPQ